MGCFLGLIPQQIVHECHECYAFHTQYRTRQFPRKNRVQVLLEMFDSFYLDFLEMIDSDKGRSPCLRVESLEFRLLHLSETEKQRNITEKYERHHFTTTTNCKLHAYIHVSFSAFCPFHLAFFCLMT